MSSNNTKENEERNIRQEEDSLFKEWALKRHPFATDGCANPKVFHESHQRIVFVLKERNWGHTIAEQKELQLRACEEIIEERDIFNGWWTLMAQWADVLLQKGDTNESWRQVQSSYLPSSNKTTEEHSEWIKERNKDSLGRCACIQLKKAPGGGGLNTEDFLTVVKEDRELILRQLSIYSPHFIVSCGSSDNWFAFKNIIFENPEINQSKNGINYFTVQIDGCSHRTAVVNFGHPSMRVNATLWGALAFGLQEALPEIFTELKRS